ncbi:hypothetical protein LTR67_006299 [Exophiala xenobiotica]
MPKAAKARTNARRAPYPESSGSGNSRTSDPGANQPSVGSSVTTNNESRPVNYLFHCVVAGTMDPMVTRMLSIPSTLTLEQMHMVMQIAFGWGNCHLWKFDLVKLYSTEKEEREDQRKNGIMPLLTFQMDPWNMQESCPESKDTFKDASKWRLCDIFAKDEFRDKVGLTYEYDFGDSWEHQISFIGVESPTLRMGLMADAEYNFPLCFAGEGHPIAEDCGSYPGWEAVKEVFTKPRSRDPEDLKNWYKTCCANGDPKGLNPYQWSILDINDDLEQIRV